MKTSSFSFELPNELIADVPVKKRDESKLLVLGKSGHIKHQKFHDILGCLNKNDVLVFNNTRVFPARLIGRKKNTGGKVEMLLNHEVNGTWEVIGKNIQSNNQIEFDQSKLKALILEKKGQLAIVEFNMTGEQFYKEIEKIGHIPLPPYIEAKRKNNHTSYDNDRVRYQTVYAKDRGSVAAPTAGLHFTNELIDQVKKKGITTLEITLHVGLGTFAHVDTEEIEQHIIHKESYSISKEIHNDLLRLKQTGHRIVAVGTTTTRVLEYIFKDYPNTLATSSNKEGWTDIYIYPGHEFMFVDALITNFHLSESSLLFLVSAFAGRENILNAYKEAIKKNYRFYSYGDAMFIN